MEKTIGELLGVFEHTYGYMSNTGAKGQVTSKFDCTTSTLAEVRSWIAGNRAIARQRVFKGMSTDDIIETSGDIVIAQDAGKKVASLADTVEMIYQGFISTGMAPDDARKYADMAANNPSAAAVAIEKNDDKELEESL